MLFKLDENIPARIVSVLQQLGHSADTALDEDLNGKPDQAVWARCQSEARLLITQDMDFSDLRQFKPGTHHGLMLVRLGHASRGAIVKRLIAILNSEAIETWAGAFVVVGIDRVRDRLP